MALNRTTAKSRAVTFIAAQDVFDFLNSLESGVKSKVINQALRFYSEQVDPDDVLSKEPRKISKAYQTSLKNELEEFAEWLTERENEQGRTYNVIGSDDKPIRLAYLLNKFGAQKKQSKFGEVLADQQQPD